MDQPMDNDLFPEGDTVVVGKPETKTAADQAPPAGEPVNLYDELHVGRPPTPGEEHAREDAGDGGEAADDIASMPEPSSEEAIRFEDYKRIARQSGVDEYEVGSWQDSRQAETYLRALETTMRRYALTGQPAAQPEPAREPPPVLQMPDFKLSEDADESILAAFNEMKKFGTGVQQAFNQWQQERDVIVNVLKELATQNQQAVTIQRGAAMDAQLKSLEPEVKALFDKPESRSHLQEEMRIIELGRQAAGSPPLSYEQLVRAGVNLVAGERLKTIERDRLAAAQKKKAKAAVPRVPSSQMSDSERDTDAAAKNRFMNLHAALAAKL